VAGPTKIEPSPARPELLHASFITLYEETMAFLELTHITKRFGAVTAVDDFNLQAARGEFVSFLGPSGCGKTTTLRMVAGFEKPTAGQIKINEVDVTFAAPNQRNIGMVFQSYALFPNMTVAGNIGFGLKIAGTPRTDIKQRVDEMLALIHLPKFGDRYPYQLSGGQQQRIALARALAIKPQLLLLDEPLSALDAKIRLGLRSEIRRIQQELGITAIYVTHDQEEALSLSDRIVVMNMGKVEQVGTPFEIYNFPQTQFVASFVGMLNQLQCTVVDAAQGVLSYQNQQLATGAPLEFPDGAPVRVFLRPEELHFGNGHGNNELNCKIETVSFLGATVRVELNLGDTTLMMDVQNERQLELPQAGQTQVVSFPPHACWVVPES
jgi:putative spermidine/putrescine transport system ATP-binding protein